MSVYVDSPVWKKSPTGKKTYAHLTADTLEELHAFATSISVKPHFFHKARSGWHYDITAEQHPAALQAGAQLVDTRFLLEKAKNLLPSELGPLSEAIRNFRRV